MDTIRKTAKLRRYALAAVALLVVVGVVAVFAAGFGSNVHEVPFMLSGKPAPAFRMKRLDTGEQVSLEQYAGKPMVLNFWSTWCGPCVQEHPVLDWGARTYGGRVTFLGIVFEDTEDNAKKFLAQQGASYPQLFDPQSTVAVDYGVSGVPETYFIDARGVILGKIAYPIDNNTLATMIGELLR